MGIRIGVDVGLTGAIAMLRDNFELVAVFDMPTMALSKGKNQINAAALVVILREAQKPVTAYLEVASAMPHQGVSSMFNFGVSYGILQGVLAAMNIPVVLVRPQAWKARAGLRGSEKDMARTLAVRLYPSAELSRKKDIGRADAILIARFGADKGAKENY